MSVLKEIGGRFINDDTCEFTVWAPLAREMNVDIVHPVEKNVSMEKDDDGYWFARVKNILPGTRYFYSINKELRCPDPASVYQPDGVHGPSGLVDLNAYQWEDETWKNPMLKNYIIYELHTGTFTGKSNFKGIIEKIDYLKELGINAVEIMPVGQFPGSRNWGYDVVYPFAVQNSYGGPLELMNLVNECHKNNIAVILDVIYNHLGPEGNYLGNFAPYFTDKYLTPWGQALNFDDAYSDGVRNYMVQNMLMWFEHFHLDGLRLDAVHAITDFSATHIMEELSRNKRLLEDKTGNKYYLIAESNLNDARYINPLEKGGYSLDSQWSDDFHHALHTMATGENFGYYMDYGSMEHLANAYKEAFVYNGIYSRFRKRTFGNKITDQPGSQFVVFSQNHDQVGNRLKGDRLSTLVSFDMLKLLAGAVFVSPYIPMLFMGEEYGEKNPFLYYISHNDPELVQAVREGRKREFKGFFEEDFFDPQDEKTFNHSRIQYTCERDSNAQKLFEFYKGLICIKKNHPVVSSINKDNMKVDIISPYLLKLERWEGIFSVVCFLNFSKDTETIVFKDNYYKDATWYKLLNSVDEAWDGEGSDFPDQIQVGQKLVIPQESITVIENHRDK